METTREVKETTATDLGSLLDAGDGAVVTLVAGDTHLVAHRAVLAARSPVFAEMLSCNSTESSSGQVRISDVEGPVLRQLLAYCYTLQAPQLPDMALKLLVAADKYRVSMLKAECERQVATQLSVETAAAAAVTTVRHSCTLLSQAAIAYMKTHIFEVMSTQGWADTVRMQPEDLVQLCRLLSESSVAAPAVGGASPPPTSQLHRDGSETPASAALLTDASCHSPPPDDTAAPPLCEPVPAAVGSSPSPSMQPHSEKGDCSRSPASAAPPTAASHHAPPPDDATVSRLRSLSAEEKNRRLREAAYQGAVGELEVLLAAGADVRAVDEWGQTALHSAARRGHEEVARRLLAAGAAWGARVRIRQWTPLHEAAARGHVAVVRLLLAAGVDHGDRSGTCGWTALHIAAINGHTEVVAALLEAGADWAARDDRGHTPLDRARQCGYRHVEELLQHGHPPPH